MHRSILLFALCLAYSSSSNAVPSYVDRWRAEYPDSTSGDVRCQLCHVQREGGSPWNTYGRDIRNTFRQLNPASRTIEQAFRQVELLNSDEDVAASSNRQEIEQNSQPGWKSGRTNFGYDRDNQIAGLFYPPVTIDPFPEKIEVLESPFEFVDVASGFTSPVGGVVAPIAGLEDQLFVVDQIGLVWRVNLESGEKNIFLDVRDRLVALGAFSPGGYDERGLLAMVFHPDYKDNGLFYTYTSEPSTGTPDFTTLPVDQPAEHQSVITEYSISNQGAQAGAAQISSSRVIMRLDQPQFNHNGGALLFDASGYLLIALGDGGGADDQGIGHGAMGNGANPTNPYGSILRIDPLASSASGRAYGIPLDNPFLGDSMRLDEIYAYGFRNPWKMSVNQSGQLIVADVGQNDVEEVNLVESGKHYGWRIREGSFYFDPNGEFSGIISSLPPDEFPTEILQDPVFEYDHDEGVSITGGYVYTGDPRSSLFGKYVFADVNKRLFIGDFATSAVRAVDLEPDIFIFSFAQDAAGDLYILGNQNATTSGTTGKLVKLQIDSESPPLCWAIKSAQGVASVCL